MTTLPRDETAPYPPFLNALAAWAQALPVVSLRRDLLGGKGPERAAVLVADMINGFCHAGPLASDRVRGIVSPVVALVRDAGDAGVGHFLLMQDTHRADAREFASYPPHCVEGTDESRTIPELAGLPIAERFTIFPKNSISADLGTGLDAWFGEHPEVDEFVAVGNCTDLCLSQLALHVTLRANALHLNQRITVPADCVETFHLSVADARAVGVLPHDGDLMHLVFLYHMALNGVNVVRRVTP